MAAPRRTLNRLSIGVLLMVAASHGSAQAPAGPPPVSGLLFRSQTELVTVSATVADRQGRPVADLQKEDFLVTEDGQRVDIAFFERDTDTPTSAVLLVDVSGSMVDKIDDVEDALRHFVAFARESDEIALVEFNTFADLVVPFGVPQARLIRALGNLRAEGGTALYDATIVGLQHLDRGTHRKKVLLLLTDGDDTNSRAGRSEAVAAATRSEALVYALGIGHGAQGSFGHGAFGLSRDSVDIRTLRALAEPTGGRAELIEQAHRQGVDLVDRTIADFTRELREQYSLGYYPARPVPDGQIRRIKVTTPARDYTVRSRTGYRRDSAAATRP